MKFCNLFKSSSYNQKTKIMETEKWSTEEQARIDAYFVMSGGDIETLHIIEYADGGFGLLDDSEYDEDDEDNDFEIIDTFYS